MAKNTKPTMNRVEVTQKPGLVDSLKSGELGILQATSATGFLQKIGHVFMGNEDDGILDLEDGSNWTQDIGDKFELVTSVTITRP